jgi:hypothetical protein
MLMTEAQSALTARDVLATVFARESGQAATKQAERRVYVIAQGAEPRWIIIGSPSKALPVLKSWAPWRAKSRMQWSAVRLAAATNLLPMLPGISEDTVSIDTGYWSAKLPEFPREWSAVLHVGTPSYTRKAILFLIDGGTRVVCAAKIPLAPQSAAAIENEAEMLDRLSRFDYLPRVLCRDRGRGMVAQSWLDGKPVSREFTKAHLKLLNSLACEGNAVRVCDTRLILQRELEESDLPFDRSVLERAMEMLDCDAILARFIEHRDFAPWNLKWIRGGMLGLLDWEWAEADGLPWLDACRYFYLDDAHFEGSGHVWEALTSNELLKRYRRQFEIPDRALSALTMRYLVRELLMEWNGGNEWLATYAYRQICALIEAASPSKA